MCIAHVEHTPSICIGGPRTARMYVHCAYAYRRGFAHHIYIYIRTQRGWHEDAYLSVTHDGRLWSSPLPLTYFKTAELRRTSPAAAEASAASTALTLVARNLFERRAGAERRARADGRVGADGGTNLLCRLTPLRAPLPGTPPPDAGFTTNETFVVPGERSYLLATNDYVRRTTSQSLHPMYATIDSVLLASYQASSSAARWRAAACRHRRPRARCGCSSPHRRV